MLSIQLATLVLAMAPSLVSAGMFPEDSLVKALNHKTFKKAMKANVSYFVD
jgi:protein disulfide-isomerase A6